MDLHLKGKAAAVMAASEGLGRASALALAREGADVAICSRREDAVRATAKHIEAETGQRCVPIVADITNAHDVERFVEAAFTDLRGLNILVTNAGGPPAGYFADMTDAQWQHSFDLTFMSAVRAIRAAIPHFRTEGGGSVVGIASTSIKQPIENLIASNSVRLGLAGLFKTLATQHAHENIRFNLALPGAMATGRMQELTRRAAEKDGVTFDEAWAAREASIPMRRVGEPIEFGSVVAWLASDASKYVTGAALQVDGGIVRSPL